MFNILIKPTACSHSLTVNIKRKMAISFRCRLFSAINVLIAFGCNIDVIDKINKKQFNRNII